MFIGEVISLILLGLIFGFDFINKASLLRSDIFNIISLNFRVFTLIISLILAKKYLNRSNFSLGLRKENALRDYSQGIIISFFQIGFVVLMAFVLNKASLRLNKSLNIKYLILFTLGWIIQGFCEELICRSLFMNGFTAFFSVKSSILFNALIFAALHIGNDSVNLIALINLFLSGLAYSLLFYLKDSIWIVAGAHSFWNMIQGNIFGISVSGSPIIKASIFRTSLLGSDLITGGSFGIEASLLCTIVEVSLIITSLFLLKKKGLIKK
ncbi:MAG: type II CAAX endopeptidase family protein [Peptoniphilaceae bacterium]|nr:type II CAAX endopeptidase family protein [Peptoniphilaceae bacterium]